jgi:hypothetical protein
MKTDTPGFFVPYALPYPAPMDEVCRMARATLRTAAKSNGLAFHEVGAKSQIFCIEGGRVCNAVEVGP